MNKIHTYWCFLAALCLSNAAYGTHRAYYRMDLFVGSREVFSLEELFEKFYGEGWSDEDTPSEEDEGHTSSDEDEYTSSDEDDIQEATAPAPAA